MDLQRDAAFLEPREIDVAQAAAAEQVALEEQRVGVEIGDEARGVDRAGALRERSKRHRLRD